MPLVRIDLAKGTSAQFRKTLGDIVYRAMVDIINVPKDDKFQIITEHPPEELNYAPSYLGIEHSPGLPVGVAELVVRPEAVARLTQALAASGWPVRR